MNPASNPASSSTALSALLWLLPICFLLGSLPFGAWIVRWRTGKDVTQLGSGNIGATNVLRTSGKLAGILTLLLDFLKGALAVWLADYFSEGNIAVMSAAAVTVMLGHGFSPFLTFKGGKAVASFAGAFGTLTPLPFLCILVLFILIVWRSKFISLASILCGVFFPFAVWLILHPTWPVLLASIFAAVFVIWRHSANIQRLRAGTENTFQWQRKN